MDRHLNAGLMTCRHDRLEEIFQVVPQLFLRHGAVCLKELVELCHALRLPAGERHSMEIFQDIVRHLLVVLLNLCLLVIQCRGTILHRMKKVCPRPVKDRHEIISHDLDAKLCEIAQRLLVILNILVARGQPDLDIVVDVHALHDVHVKAVVLDLMTHLLDLVNLPHLACRLVMQRPYKSGHTGNLPDLFLRDAVISLAVPAKSHLHIIHLLI